MTTRSPNVLVVHPSVAANSTKELIALAKAKPGELNYSSALTGGSTHLSAELFKAMAGVNIVRIAYKGSAPAFNDLVAGQTQLMFATVTQVVQFVKTGRLRALAITTAQPSPLFPGLPTVSATITGYESTAMFGVFAPARTPPAVVNRLNRDIARVLNGAEIKDKFTNMGVETIGSTPAELAVAMKAEMASMGKVIRDAGIRAD
jgi:tripartite-type tricarboxylate transporter receptor subunit TctC